MARLMPSVLTLFDTMGLRINLTKSCLLGARLPARLPGTLSQFAMVPCSKYLGLPFLITEADDHLVAAFCHRATTSFFSNRAILVHQSAPRALRLRLFNSLVTASIRWSLCVLPVTQTNLHKLRVHHCTLLTWVLGGRAHPSWFDVQCIAALRHAVKVWMRVFGQPWDWLLATMVWQWLGHVLRMPDTALVKQVLTSLQSTERGRTRYRTGPNNSGHRSALRYLHQRGISHAVASDRHQWQDEQEGWLLHHGLRTGTSAALAFRVPDTCYLWERRCLQGAFHGQQVFPCMIGENHPTVVMELDRTLGWRAKTSNTPGTVDALLRDVWNTTWIKHSTFHVRIILFSRDEGASKTNEFLLALPVFQETFSHSCIVAEISKMPHKWLRRMILLADQLVDD